MFLPQLQLAYLNYLELSKLQNYNLCESLIKSCEAPKSGKGTTGEQINKSLKKYYIYIFIGDVIGWVYQDSQPSAPSVPKGKSKIQILLVKMFSLKQKAKSNNSRYFRENFFFLRHNQTYPGIIQVYLGIFGTLSDSGIESWYIQNPDIFSTRSIPRTLTYSEPWHTPTY